MQLSPDGKALAIISAAAGVGLHNPTTGALLRRVAENGPVSDCAFSADGKWLYTATGARLAAWNAQAGAPGWTWTGKGEQLHALCIAPGGAFIAAIDEPGHRVLLWKAGAGQLIRSVPVDGEVRSVAFTPDSRTLACGTGLHGRMGLIALVDVASGKTTRWLEGQRDLIADLTFSPDGKWLVSAAAGRSLKLWNWPGGTDGALLVSPVAPARQVAFSADGRRLVSAGEDGMVRLWDLVGRRELSGVGDWRRRWTSFALAPDGRTLLVAAENPNSNSVPSVERWHLP